MKKALITGASGFVGQHLLAHIQSLGSYTVYGTFRNGDAPINNGITYIQLDLQDRVQVQKVVRDIKPDFVFHLAAQASVPESIKDPVATFHTNIDSQIYLLEALREEKLMNTRLLLVSSAEVYGYIKPEDIPVDELTPHRPANPYAVSKIAQDYLGFQYSLSYKMPIIRVRPFNHIGPGQRAGFVVADFAKQIAEIEKGKQRPVLRVGSLDAKRDFTDVRDIVRLYPLLLEKGIPGEVYNAGAGVSRSVREILDLLLSISSIKISIEQDPTKLRPSDIPDIRADITKVQKITAWKPEISFEKTITDILNYWRSVV